MPEMDGLDATRAIRLLEKERNGRTPIIAMTANAMTEDRQRCLEAGMDDHLPKPVRQDALAAMLDAWLTNRVRAEDDDPGAALDRGTGEFARTGSPRRVA
jgi:CheY-like chemotaxis protein